MSIRDYIRNIRIKYENRDVREDMAKALEYLVSAVTGIKHNSGAANLFEYPAEITELNGIVFEPTDSGVHVYGVATAASWLALDWGSDNMTVGKPYVASLGKNGSGAVYLSIGYFLDDTKSAHATIGATESIMNFVCPSQYKSSRNMVYIPAGSNVDCVVNPRLRLANEEDPTQPETYTVEEISEKIHTGSIGGGNGYKVVTQASQMIDTDTIYVYMGSESGYTNGYWYYHNGSAWTRGAQFYLGRDGVDGVSPAANVAAITGGCRVTVIDRNGTTSVDLHDATNVDQEARTDIAEEITRATEAEDALGARIDEIGQRSFDWETVITDSQYGPVFKVLVCTGLGLMTLVHYGIWSSIPETSGKWITLGQSDLLKYAEGMPSDFAKHHYLISKDSKAEVWITPAGEVKWGMTATVSGNANAKVAKGNGTRAMLTFTLPSVLAPIEDPGRSIKMMRKVDLSDD
jgi:hypothetical protein